MTGERSTTSNASRERLHAAFIAATRWGDASSLDTIVEQPRDRTEESVRDLWAGAPVRRDEMINHVYVHVPFCKSICTFCNYKRLRPSSPELLGRYLDRLERSLTTLAPALARHRFHTLYLGGGTPTVLPAERLDRLLTMLDRHVPFVPGGRRVVEADPAVLGLKRARVLASHGVHHVSMGVQSLDPDVIEAHDRGRQDADLVGRRVRELRSAGIHELSFDLLLGMKGTTPDTAMADLERLIERFEPAWVDVYALTPTRRYVDLEFDGDFEAFQIWQAPFLADVERRMPGLAGRLGYHLGGSPGHHWSLRRRGGEADLFARTVGRLGDRVAPLLGRLPLGEATVGRIRGLFGRVGAHGGPSYTQLVSEQQAPMHLLGLGYSARSRLFGRARLVYEDPEDDPMADGPAHYRGSEITPADEARSYLIHMWRDGRPVDRARFASLFGVALEDFAGAALSRWRIDGRVEETDGGIVLDPGERDEGLATLLWLFDPQVLEDELASRRGIDRRPEKILEHLSPLTVGSDLADGWRWHDLDGPRLVLRGPDGDTMGVRVVADPSARRGAALSVEQDPLTPSARAAVQTLRDALAASGGGTWGHDGGRIREPKHPAAQR